MPRQTNPQFALLKTQKKVITSRLMQISLKVDDYIYKDIPIPANTAALYIKEVTAYKERCFDDKRSLQVIEKLVRCMKGIIEEQKELQNPNDDVENLPPPVDEDLTQLTKEKGAIVMVLKETESHENSSQLNDKKYKTGKPNTAINEPMDGFPSTNEKNNIKETENKIQDIDILHRAISELSIKDDPLPTEKVSFQECSQSVLADFNNDINSTYKCNENMVVNENDIQNFVHASISKQFDNGTAMNQSNENLVANIRTTNVEDLIQANSIYTVTDKTKPETSIVVQNNRKRKLLNCVSLANDVADVRTTEFSADSNPESNIKPSKKKSERKPRKIIRKVNKNVDRSNKKNKKSNKALEVDVDLVETTKKNQDIKDINVFNKTGEDKSDSVSVKPSKNILNRFPSKITNITTQNNNFSLEYQSNTNSSVNFYDKNCTSAEKQVNNNNIDDLSWMENLRYIREISAEESTLAYYDDSFWNNYMLPNDWNDSEFL